MNIPDRHSKNCTTSALPAPCLSKDLLCSQVCRYYSDSGGCESLLHPHNRVGSAALFLPSPVKIWERISQDLLGQPRMPRDNLKNHPGIYPWECANLNKGSARIYLGKFRKIFAENTISSKILAGVFRDNRDKSYTTWFSQIFLRILLLKIPPRIILDFPW